MHELGITQDIIDIVSQHAGDSKVNRIVLEIGKLSAVSPDAVRFCFDICAEGTVAEGAELKIIETPGLACCRSCGNDVVLERPFGRCQCGETDLEWREGEELRIREMEVV